ncbi:MAG TPA: MFS transporter [Stellaceae bacterium]|nr:MFS transporter [Stellaceae bacterium]
MAEIEAEREDVMLELLDRQQSLTANQWKIVGATTVAQMLDFFDFLLIGFVLAFFVRNWHLTYGKAGMILLASGVSAVPGGYLFGWLGDKIGRRKVFMITILMFSIATGLMAVTPHGAWMYLAAMRLIVGLGVAGMASVSLPLLQEFVPTSKRGFVGGLSMSLMSAAPLLGAVLSAYLGNVIGWRGLFAVGLLPALLALVIFAWVPESPRWLARRGRIDEARRSLAWALQVDPATISLPAVLPEVERTRWLDVFKYPRSLVAGILTGISQTGGIGLALWGVVLLSLILRITPAEASFLTIWITLVGFPGRVFGSWISEALGRCRGGALTGIAAGAILFLAGYLHDVYIGSVSMYFLLIMLHTFVAGGNFAIVFPYMSEIWPSKLRASGFGVVYGTSSLGKFIGPAGLALIAGASNYVTPKATLAALVPAFAYFASWYILAVVAFLFIGIETKGRTIEELDMALGSSAAASRPRLSLAARGKTSS